MSARLLVFGDSIVYGAWDPQGGWADRLKRDLHVRSVTSPGAEPDQKFQLLNLGVGGHTSENLVNRVAAEIADRQSDSWPFVFVVGVGMNDGRLLQGQSQVSQQAYLYNLESMVEIFRRYSDRILLVGLTPLGADEVTLKDAVYQQELVELYDGAAKAWAAEHSIAFVDTLSATRHNPEYRASLVDGLHPGEAGHQILYDVIKPHIQALLAQ